MPIRQESIRTVMESFFQVTDLKRVLELASRFDPVDTEQVRLYDALERILADDVRADADLPDFGRAIMDGYAVQAASSFGASEGNPAYLNLIGRVAMGEQPQFTVGPGEAAAIATGGMLPEGADSVVMLEYASPIDDDSIEVFRSVAPGQNVIGKGEDFQKGELLIRSGTRIRFQELGVLAAYGHSNVRVFRKPVIGIISTGDEIEPIDASPGPGRLRDINSYTLAGMVADAGGQAEPFGIIRDEFDKLLDVCSRALERTDMVLISGGSSVGTRDYSVRVMNALPASEILVHGIPISPGKPTILARSGAKAVWGLPGHIASSIMVFHAVVRPMIERLGGLAPESRRKIQIPARISRNLASAQGRVDFVRVRLTHRDGEYWSEPVLGKSALIRTLLQADGVIEIPMNSEGLEKGAHVDVTLLG